MPGGGTLNRQDIPDITSLQIYGLKHHVFIKMTWLVRGLLEALFVLIGPVVAAEMKALPTVQHLTRTGFDLMGLPSFMRFQKNKTEMKPVPIFQDLVIFN